MSHLLRFPGFLTNALTLSYDDGVYQDERLINIMREHGLRGTFNIPSGYLGREGGRWLSKERALEVYSYDGCEIAAHGYNHYNMTALESQAIVREITYDREILEKTFGRVVRGMAYAFGGFNASVMDTLRICGIEYARTTISTENFNLPTDWLSLNPTCHHKNPKLFELFDKFISRTQKGYWSTKPQLFYLWGHSYEFDNDNNWSVIEEFAKRAGERRDIWFATNGEIFRYVKAFERLRFSADLDYVDNPSATDVYINVLGSEIIVPAGKEVKIK